MMRWELLIAAVVLLTVTALSWRVTRRRRFWCSLTRLDVEVEFEERGLPGFRHQSAVLSCSLFDPLTSVACRRQCLDSQFRRQWDSALPLCTGRQS